MCVFIHEGKTLATKGYDKDKAETFYRLIGGSVEFGEKSEDGIRREIQEELKCEVEKLSLVKIVENIFTYESKPGHEVVFVYKGDLSNKELYGKETIRITEPYGELSAEWISVDDVVSDKIRLYPALDYSTILK